MTDQWICPQQVFEGKTLKAGMALRVEDGRIADTCPVDQLPVATSKLEISGTIAPGFVDLQVNGGGGILLNKSPTPEGMYAIADAHRQYGTVALMPTVITDAPEVMAEAARAAISAKGEAGIVGLHIEGPHISLARRGTHAAQHVRPLDDKTLMAIASLVDAEITVLITLAPEAATPAQIHQVCEMGVIVSLGHTDATSEQAYAAFDAGANCVTHLFNAMSPMLGRGPGVVGAALNSDVYVGIICDGHHVADEMVGLAVRARPVPGRMFLVSDAMPTVGGPNKFELYGEIISLDCGKLINAKGGLAGAHVSMADSVKRLINNVNIDPETALKMAISVPAELIGMPDLSMVVGRSLSDLLVLDGQFAVSETVEGFVSRQKSINDIDGVRDAKTVA